MPEPTKEDAKLYLTLLEITQGRAHAEARRWVLSDFAAKSYDDLNAKYPPGSVERDHLTNVLGFFESAAVLVSRGLLHEDVFYDAPFAFETLWPKVKKLIEQWQKSSEDPAVWENVVWLGKRYELWKEQVWKPKLEAMPPEKAPEKVEPAIRGFQH